MKVYDTIVVGSGCSGAMAAQTLVEAGANVLMLDTGFRDTQSTKVPTKDFLELRRTDSEQYRYFIGEKAQGLAVGELGKGAQLTPPRRYMLANTDTYIPLESSTFSPLESLGYGGLGIGWGLQCWEFSAADMAKTGLSVSKMRAAYETVARRIGISASADAPQVYTIGNLETYQPSAKADRNHRRLQRIYRTKQARLQRQGFFVGRTPLALLTKNQDDRKAYAYRDMDFYDDNDQSAWRPWMTVDRLQANDNFSYIGNKLVTSFSELDDIVSVHCLDTESDKPVTFACKKLILASGALGTARIVLRAQGKPKTRLPFLCNPHTYVPFIQPALIGKGPEKKKLGLGQLSYFLDKQGEDSNLSVASSYGYQSLMMFRLINQLPLDFASGRALLQYLMPSFVIMIIQHPDLPSDNKYLELVKDDTSPTGDKLSAHYKLSQDDEVLWELREKQYVKYMRKLRAYALKRVKTKHGSSVHYAGTVPFSSKDKPLTLSPNGRLHGTQHVYVADSSGFTYLPAKGLTFSILANAHITAENVLHDKA